MWSVQQANDPAQLRLAAELLGLANEITAPCPLPPCPYAAREEPTLPFRAVLVYHHREPAHAIGLHLLSRGRGIVYLPPRLAWQALPLRAQQALSRLVAEQLAREPQLLWQVLPSAEQALSWRHWLLELGFEPLSCVQYWRCQAGGGFSGFQAPGRIAPAATISPGELIALVERTYEQSRDFPELAGIDSPREALASYYHTGTSGNRYWYVGFTAQGVPVGAVLLAEMASSAERCWELCYLGVAPRFRGQGWGEALLRYALQQAGQHRVQKIVLGVDQRNEPAVRLYRRMGFELFDQREVFCRLPRAGELPPWPDPQAMV